MYFKGNDGYQNSLVFDPMLNSFILDSNAKVTDWISTRLSSEKIKPFDTGLEPTMSNNGGINLKFNSSVFVQKSIFLLYSNFILNIYIVYELNAWPRNPTNNFLQKTFLFGTVKLVRNVDKSKFIYNVRAIAVSWSFGNEFVRNAVISY